MAYLVVWEFTVRARMRKRFEKDYGTGGAWVNLFRQDSAYIGTEVMQDVRDRSRYLTVDFWESEAAYEAFRKSRKRDYQRIDALCELMTVAEREVGRFSGFGPGVKLWTKARRSRAKTRPRRSNLT